MLCALACPVLTPAVHAAEKPAPKSAMKSALKSRMAPRSEAAPGEEAEAPAPKPAAGGEQATLMQHGAVRGVSKAACQAHVTCPGL